MIDIVPVHARSVEPYDSLTSDLPKYWEPDYIKQQIDHEPNMRHRMLFQFLWMTGCRITEAITVRKRDIDFQHYTIQLRWLKSRKYKSRNIPMHPKLRDILQLFVSPLKSDDQVFPYTRQRAWQLVKRRFDGHPHMFRHSFAVHWMRQGGRIEILSQVLGHSDIKTTMIYQRIVPVDQGKELLKVEF